MSGKRGRQASKLRPNIQRQKRGGDSRDVHPMQTPLSQQAFPPVTGHRLYLGVLTIGESTKTIAQPQAEDEAGLSAR